MFYTQEQVDQIMKATATLRSTAKSDVSLCQYNGVSCVRCCLPHIGGDHIKEESDEKIRALEEKNYGESRRRYANRYLGPRKILMKFQNLHPRIHPRFAISAFEDSFKDVGKEEMERRLVRRRELFTQVYDPANPEKSLKTYKQKIQVEEGYSYQPGTEFGGFFPGCGVEVDPKKGLPECHLLGFVDKNCKTPGCLAHPKSEITRGFDGRNLAGFFKHDACVRCSCEWSEEFPYLSDSARKVFNNAIKGMSWYEYSRHSTAVLVSYLRGYDFLIQKIDEKGILDSLSLENIVEFTNTLFDNWKFKKPQAYFKSRLKDYTLPVYPIADETLIAKPNDKQNSNLEYFRGRQLDLDELTKLEKAKSELPFGEERSRLHSSILASRKKLFPDVPYVLVSTKTGYRIDIRAGHRRIKIPIEVKGSRPYFRKEDRELISRFGYNGSGLNTIRGEKSILDIVRSELGDIGEVSYWKNLEKKGVAVQERMTYMALDSIFFKKHFKRQLAIMRRDIDDAVDGLVERVRGEELI